MVAVPLPKSKSRFQLAVEFSLTHATIEKLLNVPTIPTGRLAYCDESDAKAN